MPSCTLLQLDFAVSLQVPARGYVAGGAATLSSLFDIGDDDFSESDADALGRKRITAAVGGYVAENAIGIIVRWSKKI